MIFKPQKTRFQNRVVDILETLNNWSINPWRRYSLALIVLLVGYFFGSSLGMISAVVEIIDPIGALFSVFFIELLIQIRRRLIIERRTKLIVLILDSFRIGLFYGFFTESLKLL